MERFIYVQLEEVVIPFRVKKAWSLREIEKELVKAIEVDDSLRRMFFPKANPETKLSLTLLSAQGNLLREEEFSWDNDKPLGKKDLSPFKLCWLKVEPQDEIVIDLKDIYRVFFSNNCNRFLPSLDRATLEVSAELNPQCRHFLIIDKLFLSKASVEALELWGKKHSYNILDISEIPTKTLNDKMLLELVRLELKYWRMGLDSMGNVGLASDFVRLLIADKGLYLDCDIFTFEGLPASMSLAQGGFGNYLASFSSEGLNNDILAFASTPGKRLLEAFKEEELQRYFDYAKPNTLESLAEQVDKIMQKRAETLQVELQDGVSNVVEVRRNFFENLVGYLTGPKAWEDFLKKYRLELSHKHVSIFDYFLFLKPNAKQGFDLNVRGSSWLDQGVDKIELKRIAAFADYLQSLNQAGHKFSMTPLLL